MIAFLTPFADAGMGYAFGFVFMVCNLFAAVMVFFFLYETKSLSLESVDRMYSDPNTKAWNSSNWVPEGYLDRNRRDSAYWQRQPSVAERTGSVAQFQHESDESKEKLGTNERV